MNEIIALKRRIENREQKMEMCCEKLELFEQEGYDICEFEEIRTYRMQNKMKNIDNALDKIENQLENFLMHNQQ